ncbi:hypothetical protein IEQ34_018986 [Dendrobium chrysotoxum]|uniref:Uncharacterized protein n=1 Tax=Dendrobium chrysotoxum TaxID=161865 RepID=A0AAV7G7H8_DENCH|nr:hypothetical protein IEQ34_018986 [Dendrobium chrysotoxum]
MFDSEEAPSGEGGRATSPRTPDLMRSRQSWRLSSSLPDRTSRSLCIWSFPTDGSPPETRSANSMASARVVATD